METVKYAMDINHEKTYEQALDFAVQRRRFLILHASQKAKQIACKAGQEWKTT